MLRDKLRVFVSRISPPLELNKSKTEATWLGSWAGRKDKPFGFRWPEVSSYALGIHFTNDSSTSDKLNFEKKLEDLQRILNSWKRKLTLLGKINIVKSLGLSKLTYNASVLPLPKDFDKKVNKTIFDFIWDNKPHKIKNNALIGDRKEGGLKTTEFDSMNKALKASCVKRFNTDINAPWKIIPNYTTQHLGGFKFLLSCNYKMKELALNNIPSFYVEILKSWNMIKSIKGECDQDKTDPHDAIIWNNSDIKIEGQSIFYKSWHKVGINKVKHLLQQNSRKFLTYEEFIKRHKVKSSFTLYYGLLSSIKSKWKITTIQRQRQTGNQNWYDNVENLSNAALHRIIVENKFQPPINEQNILSYGVNVSDIHKIYNWPFLTTKNSKLIMLQFKINHNIIYTKDKLKKVNLISNDVCHLCEREKHTIKHMMLKCTYVTLFWNEFFAWWAQITNEKIHLPDSVLLYGPVNLSKHNQVLSLALLVAKYFIYKCNIAEDPLLFSLFKLHVQFRENILTERYIAMKNKTARLFNDKWHCFIIKDFVSKI